MGSCILKSLLFLGTGDGGGVPCVPNSHLSSGGWEMSFRIPKLCFGFGGLADGGRSACIPKLCFGFGGLADGGRSACIPKSCFGFEGFGDWGRSVRMPKSYFCLERGRGPMRELEASSDSSIACAASCWSLGKGRCKGAFLGA